MKGFTRDEVTDWEGFGPLVPRLRADLAKPQYRRTGTCRWSQQESVAGSRSTTRGLVVHGDTDAPTLKVLPPPPKASDNEA